jgi:YesN/AraC family two-component response regulator
MKKLTDPKSVLIVDDDPIARRNFIQICDDLKLFKNIIEDADGKVASQKIANQEFDLIIIDLKMPKKSGLEVIRDAIYKRPNIAHKFLVISGNVEPSTLQIIMSKNVKNILVKPFDMDVIENKIKSIVRLSERVVA